MKRNIVRIFAPLVLIASLGACAESGINKQTGGTLLGGAAGGLLGSRVGSGSGQLAATAAGALLGALLGSEVGQSLDKVDAMYASRTQQSALEHNKAGQATTWSNPDSGHAGTVTPTRTYQTAQGEYCREYQQSVRVGGKMERAYGTACRRPDGSWEVVN